MVTSTEKKKENQRGVGWHLLSRPPLHRLEYRRGQGADVVGGGGDFQPGQAGEGLIDELLVLLTRKEAVLDYFTEIRRSDGRPEASIFQDLVVLELYESSGAYSKRWKAPYLPKAVHKPTRNKATP